jgi:hypothetical protein
LKGPARWQSSFCFLVGLGEISESVEIYDFLAELPTRLMCMKNNHLFVRERKVLGAEWVDKSGFCWGLADKSKKQNRPSLSEGTQICT